MPSHKVIKCLWYSWLTQQQGFQRPAEDNVDQTETFSISWLLKQIKREMVTKVGVVSFCIHAGYGDEMQLNILGCNAFLECSRIFWNICMPYKKGAISIWALENK